MREACLDDGETPAAKAGRSGRLVGTAEAVPFHGCAGDPCQRVPATQRSSPPSTGISSTHTSPRCSPFSRTKYVARVSLVRGRTSRCKTSIRLLAPRTDLRYWTASFMVVSFATGIRKSGLVHQNALHSAMILLALEARSNL